MGKDEGQGEVREHLQPSPRVLTQSLPSRVKVVNKDDVCEGVLATVQTFFLLSLSFFRVAQNRFMHH